MLELLLLFVAVVFFLGLLKIIWDILKGLILGILGIGIIIAAVVFLGPIILSVATAVVGVLGPLLLSALPLILPLILLAAIISFIWKRIRAWREKRKYLLQLRWLEKRGIAKTSDNTLTDWSTAAELDYVEITPEGYVISTFFYDRVITRISQTGAFTRDAFGKCCVHCAREFQVAYVDLLLEFMQNKDLLFPLSASIGETYYLPKPFVEKCENLLLTEGAATRDEFTNICRNSAVTRELHQECSALAVFILNRMLSRGEIDKIELTELGDWLYVAKDQTMNSKMIRREIILD